MALSHPRRCARRLR